jgi:hypothetical protein
VDGETEEKMVTELEMKRLLRRPNYRWGRTGGLHSSGFK